MHQKPQFIVITLLLGHLISNLFLKCELKAFFFDICMTNVI